MIQSLCCVANLVLGDFACFDENNTLHVTRKNDFLKLYSKWSVCGKMTIIHKMEKSINQPYIEIMQTSNYETPEDNKMENSINQQNIEETQTIEKIMRHQEDLGCVIIEQCRLLTGTANC